MSAAFGQRWSAQADAFMRGSPARRLLRAVFLGLYRTNATTVASAMAFQFFLALLPIVGLATWLGSHLALEYRDLLYLYSASLDLAPAEAQRLLRDHVGDFSTTTAPLAIVGAVWLASGGFHGMLTAFEETHRGEPRSYLYRRGVALASVGGLLLSVCAGATISVALGAIPDWLRRNLGANLPAAGLLEQVISVVLTLGMLVALLAFFFRIGIQSPYALRRTLPGSLLAISLCAAASYGFALYVRTLSRYAVYYGGLAAVVIVLVWLWLCSLALLIGVELNTQLEAFEHGQEDGP